MKRTGFHLLMTIVCLSFATLLYAGNEPGKISTTVPSVQKVIPETILLESLEDKYEPVEFDHAMHTSIAESCSKCHHQHNELMECDRCHSIDSSIFKKSVINNFMSCQDCHGTFDPTDPGMPGLRGAYHQTCFQCHKGMGNVGLDPKACTESCHAKKSVQANR